MIVKNKIKVGLAQINNSFSGQNYFPYSVGVLHAFAEKYLKDLSDFEFFLPIYSRVPVKCAVDRLVDADIVFFSTYAWNIKISLKIAEEIKKKKADVVIVFGGPQVPKKIEDFLQQYGCVDIACYGEGEYPFLAILENYRTGDWSKAPSVAYKDSKGEIIRTPSCERITNFGKDVSPYLAGTFDPLMKANPNEEWLVLWETNRGCPFSCAFCDWGSAIHRKVCAFDLERIFNEVDWFSKQHIEFVYCCDANFGILPRDIEIVKYVADNKKKYGYPKALSVQNTKNSTEHSYEIQKILSDAGLNKGVTLALQSVNKDVLKSVNRHNISIDVFQELQNKFTADSIKTYTDIILGLPCETYDSFKNGVSQVIENGQHNRIQFNNLSILPNSEMNEKDYQRKYGLITQETNIINIHGSMDEVEEVYETQRLVVGTNSMSKEDWVKTRVFSWMTALLHFDKILQIPLIILNKVYSISFRELLEVFTEGKNMFPIISEIRSFFMDKAVDVQNGGAEYCQSKEWLNIWWPADELVMIRLCNEGKLTAFYEEAKHQIEHFLNRKGYVVSSRLLGESMELNKKLVKLPFLHEDISVQLPFNIYEVYQSALKGMSIPISEGIYNYRIDRKNKTWSSWEEWCKEVIWYENKKGAYLYNCYSISQEES